MYHSTTVLLDDCETLYVQGSLAVSPFNTSTLGATSTVTAPLHTAEKHTKTKRKNMIEDLSIESQMTGSNMLTCFNQYFSAS